MGKRTESWTASKIRGCEVAVAQFAWFEQACRVPTATRIRDGFGGTRAICDAHRLNIATDDAGVSR